MLTLVEADLGGMSIPNRGVGDSKQRRNIKRYLFKSALGEGSHQIDRKIISYLGSKKCRFVGIPGKESWQTNNGMVNLALRSSSVISLPRSAYNSGKASNSKTACMRIERMGGGEESDSTY